MKLSRWPIIGTAGLLLAGCSDFSEEADLEPEELRFKIVQLNKVAFSAEAKVLSIGSSAGDRFSSGAELIRLLLSRGDASYLEVGDVCRAKLGNSREDAFQVENVWPDDDGLRERLELANLKLRRSVERRGAGNVALEIDSILPEFAVIDQDGEVIEASFFDGKTTLVSFFFTRCSNPAKCLAATQRFKLMLEKASEAGISNLQVLSLSFDPEHDVPGVLKDYAQAYQLDESRHRLGTGSKQVLDDLRQRIGISTRKDPALIIDHTFRVVAVDGHRRVAAEILGPLWSIENTLARIRLVVQEEDK